MKKIYLLMIVLAIACSMDAQVNLTKIELLSITGQMLLSEFVNAKAHRLNLIDFAEGIYFVRLSYADGQSVIKKIIKQ